MSMKRFMNKKVVAIGLAAGITLGGAGAAFAYFTTGGTGAGSASTGVSNAIVVNQTSTDTGLLPGGVALPLSGDFTNTTNTGNVFVGSVTAVVSSVTNTGTNSADPTCTPADYKITGTATVNAEVPNGTHVGSWSGLSISMIDRQDTVAGDNSGNQDNCQGATPQITYTANN